MQVQSLRECAGELCAACLCLLRVCVCVHAGLHAHVVNYSFVSHWRAAATRPLSALDEWVENPSSHEITDYILSARPRGLDGGKKGKEGEEEERRGGDKRKSSKLERERRKWTKGRKKADCKEKGSVSEAAAVGDGEREKNENESSWNAIVRSYQDGRALLLPKALQWAAECLVHRRWPQQISAKIWITLGLNWPLNTQ